MDDQLKNAILDFTGLGYNAINEAIRKNKVTKELKQKIHNLDEALDNLPGFDNSTLYRIETVFEWEIMRIYLSKRIGQVIMRPDYLSTNKIMRKDNQVNLIISTIENSNAKDVGEIVKTRRLKLGTIENEVLIKRNTNFEIVKVNYKREIIYLKETKKEEHSLFSETEIYNDEDVKAFLDKKHNM